MEYGDIIDLETGRWYKDVVNSIENEVIRYTFLKEVFELRDDVTGVTYNNICYYDMLYNLMYKIYKNFELEQEVANDMDEWYYNLEFVPDSQQLRLDRMYTIHEV